MTITFRPYEPEPGTLAAALAMAHCDAVMQKMTGSQIARAIAIMDSSAGAGRFTKATASRSQN